MEAHNAASTKKARLKELRANIEEVEVEKAKEILEKLSQHDKFDQYEVTKYAALGISRLLIPATQVTLLDNVGTTRNTIYNKLLKEGYL
jgi:hypothetical protein